MAKKKAKMIRVTQVRSGIGRQEKHRRTLRALGLKRHQQSVVHEETPAIRKTGWLQIYPAISYGRPYRLSYSLDGQTTVRVRIHDATGRVVTSREYAGLDNEGELMINMDGLTSGVYFIKVEAGTAAAMSKVIWVR